MLNPENLPSQGPTNSHERLVALILVLSALFRRDIALDIDVVSGADSVRRENALLAFVVAGQCGVHVVDVFDVPAVGFLGDGVQLVVFAALVGGTAAAGREVAAAGEEVQRAQGGETGRDDHDVGFGAGGLGLANEGRSGMVGRTNEETINRLDVASGRVLFDATS